LIKLERLARDKHSSFLRKSVNRGLNKFYDTGPDKVNIMTLGTLTIGEGSIQLTSLLHCLYCKKEIVRKQLI
jgi:hypothetical protein